MILFFELIAKVSKWSSREQNRRNNPYYSGPYLCHVVSRALGNIYAVVTVRLPMRKGFLNASISRDGAKRAWIFETDIHLRLLCYLADAIAERYSIPAYIFFFIFFFTFPFLSFFYSFLMFVLASMYSTPSLRRYKIREHTCTYVCMYI